MRIGRHTPRVEVARELALLVRLCRRDSLSNASISLADFRVSVPTLIGVASRHGVGGLAVGRLSRIAKLRTDLPEAERRLRRRDALMRELEKDVIATLRDRGIEPVVAKGSAIARFYDRPHERGATDLDVLVERSRVEDAIEALGERRYRGPRESVRDAYRRSHFHIPLHHEDGHVVEIHWGLVRPSWPFQLDASVVRQQATRDPSDPSAPTYPTAEHLILILVLQNLQEGFARLSRTVDLDRVISGAARVRWDELHRLARAGGLRNALAVSLRLCRLLFETPIPGQFEAEIRPTWWTRRHLDMERPVETLLEQRLDLTWATRLVFEFWLADRASAAWKRLIVERELGQESEALFGRGIGTVALVTRLPKLLARQVTTYGSAAVRFLSGRRSGIRFWSPDAGDADLLRLGDNAG